jgi:hypothetical protein
MPLSNLTMRTIFKTRRTTLLFIAALTLFFSIFYSRHNEPKYRGRTVEQWLRSSDWTTRQDYVANVIIDLEDQGAAALQKLLLGKHAALEESLLAKIPFAKTLHGSRLTKSELKERIITNLEAFGLSGLKCLPALLTLAKSQNEPLRIRHLAIRKLSRLTSSEATKEALATLTNDLDVAWVATDGLAEITRRQQQQQHTAELHNLRRQMDQPNLQTPDLLHRTSLWQAEPPGVNLITERPSSP